MEVLCGFDRAKTKAFADPDVDTEAQDLWRALAGEKGAHAVSKFL